MKPIRLCVWLKIRLDAKVAWQPGSMQQEHPEAALALHAASDALATVHAPPGGSQRLRVAQRGITLFAGSLPSTAAQCTLVGLNETGARRRAPTPTLRSALTSRHDTHVGR